MKVEDIETRVAAIAAVARDNEVAHSLEDQLFLDVLKAIASGQRNAKALAEAALKTTCLGFKRYRS